RLWQPWKRLPQTKLQRSVVLAGQLLDCGEQCLAIAVTNPPTAEARIDVACQYRSAVVERQPFTEPYRPERPGPVDIMTFRHLRRNRIITVDPIQRIKPRIGEQRRCASRCPDRIEQCKRQKRYEPERSTAFCLYDPWCTDRSHARNRLEECTTPHG